MKEKLGAALVCLLFAIPFGGIGVGASWVVARMLLDAQRAQDWVGVRANVVKFGRASVDYTYSFNGVDYHGDRLGVNPIGGRDNIDSWQQDMFSMLSEAKMRNKPITVWVNPDNPAESMVDRAIRWKLVVFALPFALGFGGVGVGALLFGLRALFRSDGVAVRSRSSGLPGRWAFAFMWNVIAFPIAVLVIPGAWADGQWGVLFVLIFPLIGLLILWGAISSTIKAIGDRFRREPELPTLPAPSKPVNDGVFARGMLDDSRPIAAGTGAIDAGDDGLPAAPDPAVAQLEKLSGKPLTREQREQLERMGPTSKAMVGKFAGWLDKMKTND